MRRGVEFEELWSVKSAMAAYLEIGNGWQSPRISFTLDLSQTDTTNDDRQSPRISFSLNLLHTDGISPEKRRREDVSYDTDFEFCVISNNNDGWNTIRGETLLPVADELFEDGKILPLIHGPLETQPVTIAGHLSLEISKCRSPVRSISSSPSKITSSCWRNVASKSLCHKAPNKWKDIMFKLSNKENSREENIRKSSKGVDRDESGNNVKQQISPTKSLCPFSRSCSTGGEMKGKCLFCSLPYSRMQSTAEQKYKVATSTSKDIESDVPVLVEGSKPLEARRISNKVQPHPRRLEDAKEETKVKRTAGRGQLGSPGISASKIRGSKSGHRTTGRVGGNGRSMVQNWERSSRNAAKAASLDSPPPGKRMAERSFLVKANNSMAGEGMKVSPVVNVSVCIGSGGGLFGFFSKREKKQPSAYHLHHSHATNANRGKGT